MADATGAARHVRRVSKSFVGNRVLGDVDLVVAPGEVHAVVGENGAGKSTLIKVIGGVHPPDAGDVLINGALCRFRSPREALAAGVVVIHQELSLAPDLSAADNIFLGRCPRTAFGTVDRRAVRARAAALLDGLGVPLEALSTGADAPGHYHPGRSGSLRQGPRPVLARFGDLHPALLRELGLGVPAAGFELFLDEVGDPTRRRRAAPALPPLPAIPEPEMTPAELAHKQAQQAEIMRLLDSIHANQVKVNLSRALSLVLMAQRGQGPLIDYLTDLGFKYAKLADNWPQKTGLRVIRGGAD